MRLPCRASAVGQRAVVGAEHDRDSQRLFFTALGGRAWLGPPGCLEGRVGRRRRSAWAGWSVAWVMLLWWRQPLLQTDCSPSEREAVPLAGRRCPQSGRPSYRRFKGEGITGWWGPYSRAGGASCSIRYRLVGSVFVGARLGVLQDGGVDIQRWGPYSRRGGVGIRGQPWVFGR